MYNHEIDLLSIAMTLLVQWAPGNSQLIVSSLLFQTVHHVQTSVPKLDQVGPQILKVALLNLVY